MNPHELVTAWRTQGKQAEYIPAPDDIVDYLMKNLTGNEVVLIMSNGGFGGIHGKLLAALAARD